MPASTAVNATSTWVGSRVVSSVGRHQNASRAGGSQAVTAPSGAWRRRPNAPGGVRRAALEHDVHDLLLTDGVGAAGHHSPIRVVR